MLGDRWDRYWYGDGPLLRLAWFRILIAGLAALYIRIYGYGYVFKDAREAGEAVGRSWNPIFLFDVLGVHPVDLPTAEWVYAAALTSAACVALGILTRISAAVLAGLFLFWTGLAYSFEKPHHDMIALAFALCALPLGPIGARLSVDSLPLRREPRELGTGAMLPIRFTQITLAMGYGFAGASKLVIAGPEWLNGYTLQGIILGHQRPWGIAMAQSTLLCQVASAVTLAAQALFPIALFWRRARWVFVPAVWGFHLSTWQTMDTGPYMSLWFCLIAFVPLEKVPDGVVAAYRRSILRGMAVSLLLGGATFATLLVTVIYVGVWAWALAVVPLALVWRAAVRGTG